jgi:hypothetical protein
MADVAGDMDAEHTASLGRRYLIRFGADTTARATGSRPS